MSHKSFLGILTSLSILSACGGGGGGSESGSGGSGGANFNCDGSCPNQSLSVADVTLILRQAVTATRSLGSAGTFSVVDRTGNVLALYQMQGAPLTTTINGQVGANGGLEGLVVQATLAAISKAGTGAYLSSQGNAFSSRTAGQIIQENYLPGQTSQPGGPLFGVQFSQLICGDVTLANGGAGPRPLPLGLSADPGGIPLYKNGDLVGGVGIEFDGLYTIDRDIQDYDDAPEERVALAASVSFEAPAQRVADNISLAGRSLRFSDISYSELETQAELDKLELASIKSEPSYTSGGIKAGTVFGTGGSGVANTVRAGIPVAVLIGRYPTRAGRALAGGVQLQVEEVDALLDSAILTANRTRAAIRTPRDTAARVSVFVVDQLGEPLGFVRSTDAPVFGIDVSLQKARAAAFISSADAGAKLAAGIAVNYATLFAAFTGRSLDGSIAFANRSIGNLARPFFPDGINGSPNGPFSLPFPGTAPGASWSVFNTGLSLDLVFGGLAGPIMHPGSVPGNCANSAAFGNRLRNGMQIFPGAVPLYRGGVLIGAIGVSGDGIDQDDLVAFYGASRRGLDYAGHTTTGDADLGFNAPLEMRADQIDLPQAQLRLRYVNCPEAPFIRDNEQNVCGEG